MWSLLGQSKDPELADLLAELAAVQERPTAAAQMSDRCVPTPPRPPPGPAAPRPATGDPAAATPCTRRNAVEIINKLQDLGILRPGELIVTTDARHYVTRERLRSELRGILEERGRVALSAAASELVVDLVHMRAVAGEVADVRGADEMSARAGEGGGAFEVALLGNDLVTRAYVTGVVVKAVEETLARHGKATGVSLATSLGFPSDVVLSLLAGRVAAMQPPARIVRGRVYSESYLEGASSAVRAALGAASEPVQVGDLAAKLGEEPELVGEAVAALVADGAVDGKLTGGGTRYEPGRHKEAMRAQIDEYYDTRGYVTFREAKVRGVARPETGLASMLRDHAGGGRGCVALDSMVVSPSLVRGLQSRVTEAVAMQGFLDPRTVLPAAVTTRDLAMLLAHLSREVEWIHSAPSPEAAAALGDPDAAIVVAGSIVVSGDLGGRAKERALAAAREDAERQVRRARADGRSKGRAARKGRAPPRDRGGGLRAPDTKWVASQMKPVGAVGEMDGDGGGDGDGQSALEALAELVVEDARACFRETAEHLAEKERADRDAARGVLREAVEGGVAEVRTALSAIREMATAGLPAAAAGAMLEGVRGVAEGVLDLLVLFAFVDCDPSPEEMAGIRAAVAGHPPEPFAGARVPAPLRDRAAGAIDPRHAGLISGLRGGAELDQEWEEGLQGAARAICAVSAAQGAEREREGAAVRALVARELSRLGSSEPMSALEHAAPALVGALFGCAAPVPKECLAAVLKVLRGRLAPRDARALAEHAGAVVACLRGEDGAADRARATMGELVGMCERVCGR